ncbi:SigF/SigG family RNA polymerase sporulation sigma factor [Gehongia tenuis]|uniref:RNA polymerase sigma factor n=1 Tax=Gehongia tenuis TaxID=2763655 RepID=A0A926D8L5_9FIRM|nr:SigF/SigG family RNA polymerase sporulation sigma factor [Gehongia tenuis]MBC8532395.1 RNA polymerase sporulation sigma factor, SigF/SigG family [Gehongia tenuis]
MSREVLLTHEEAIALIKRAQQGDEEASETMVERNIALVKSIVKKFLNRGVDYDDLFQIGCLGLVKAVQNYDLQYNVRFSTYAVPMIAGEIKRFLRDDGMVKVSRSVKEQAFKILAVQEQMKKELGRDPTIQEVATRLEMEPEEAAVALESIRSPVSIFEPVNDGGNSNSPVLMMDRIAEDDSGPQVIDRILLRELIAKLSPRERQIIILRFFKDQTQSQIARVLGVSQVQVSRLETKILSKMREAAGGA